ncbi:YceG family protein [Bacillus altitudinis]|uniref:YceG family protein n=1 Tax=Bacillus altitudinis TaxID=293387 RepID=UPI001F386E1A|nr:YceG family protein [Bacillus altitudinis]
MVIGCDVVVFDGEGKDEFGELDGEEKVSFIDEYGGRSKVEPFGSEKRERK